MIPLDRSCLTEDEVLFQRMESFHCERLEEIANGGSCLKKGRNGMLVAHLIPVSTVRIRRHFEGSELKAAVSSVSAFGSQRNYSKFNIDGVQILEGSEAYKAYTQIFRDGKIEAVLTDVSYELKPQASNSPDQQRANVPFGLRDSICESALLALVKDYFEVCKKLAIPAPFFLFSALTGCQGVRIVIDRSWGDLSTGFIDRPQIHFPEIEFAAPNAETDSKVRSWCDTLWQSCGIERSLNFDESGKWRSRWG